MGFVLITLRLLHIAGGALWAGAAIAYLFFFAPTAQGLGPAGPRFTQDLMNKHRYPLFMNVSSMLTIVAGLGLLWLVSGGLRAAWMLSGPGMGFTIGSVAAIAAFGVGFFGIRPRAQRMGAIGAAIEAAGGPPTAEQSAELQRLRVELHRLEQWDVGLLIVSLVTMATARYWMW
ncbi:MAG TPA: hypothetical protein PKD53_03370 [Chloroflexaceae bacterium]|nr:hypothetical protein [Chloroflexaceae bacterium]